MTEAPLTPRPRKKGRIYSIIGSIAILAAAIFAGLFVWEMLPYWQGNRAYASIAGGAVQVDKQMLARPFVPPTAQPTATPDPSARGGYHPTPVPTLTADQIDLWRIRSTIRIDFEKLQAINPEIVGWIYSDHLPINYPILLGKDNDYYLNHLPDGTVNKLGSIFMDYRNQADFSDDTTVLYGHNMRDDSMFASLERYHTQEFFDAHPSIYIFIPGKVYRVDFFAGYVAETHDITSLYQHFESPAQRNQFIASSLARSRFVSPVKLFETDRYVSLITCDYSLADSRWIMQGKLIDLTP